MTRLMRLLFPAERYAMGYKQDDFAGAVVGLILCGFLASDIGSFLNSKFKFSSGNGLIEFFVGAVVFFIVVAAIVGIALIGYRLVTWQKSWSRCIHGVPGGKARNLCAKCVTEQNASEASQQRKRELEERQRQINADASGLQERAAPSRKISRAEHRRVTAADLAAV